MSGDRYVEVGPVIAKVVTEEEVRADIESGRAVVICARINGDRIEDPSIPSMEGNCSECDHPITFEVRHHGATMVCLQCILRLNPEALITQTRMTETQAKSLADYRAMLGKQKGEA